MIRYWNRVTFLSAGRHAFWYNITQRSFLEKKITTFYVDKNAENQYTTVSPMRLEFSQQYPRGLTTD